MTDSYDGDGQQGGSLGGERDGILFVLGLSGESLIVRSALG